MESTREHLKTRLTTLWNEILFYKNQVSNLELELNRLIANYGDDDLENVEELIINKIDEYSLYVFNNEQEIRQILMNNYKLY